MDTKKQSTKRIAVIPGDGIGQEVIPQAVNVIRASGADVDLTDFDWGADRYLRDKTTVPPDGFALLARDFDAIFVGAFGDPRVNTNVHAKEILLGMRFKMDLYANVRPVRLLDAALCPLKGVEPKISTSSLSAKIPRAFTPTRRSFQAGNARRIATQEDINTRRESSASSATPSSFCERTPKPTARRAAAFCICDKSNAMTHAGGLWQRVFKEVSADTPDRRRSTCMSTRSACRWCAIPRQFDVIVTNNMFGDIITDLAAGLQGGLGMAASANIHPGKTSMFEPVHGSAPPIAGRNMANPFGAILTAAMMLAHLG